MVIPLIVSHGDRVEGTSRTLRSVDRGIDVTYDIMTVESTENVVLHSSLHDGQSVTPLKNINLSNSFIYVFWDSCWNIDSKLPTWFPKFNFCRSKACSLRTPNVSKNMNNKSDLKANPGAGDEIQLRIGTLSVGSATLHDGGNGCMTKTMHGQELHGSLGQSLLVMTPCKFRKKYKSVTYTYRFPSSEGFPNSLRDFYSAFIYVYNINKSKYF